MRRNWTYTTAGMLLALTFAGGVSGATTTQTNLAEKIRHELVMLPYYSVFDSLAFRYDGGEVILTGQVTRPTLRTDAARVVASIPGVHAVRNEIEVLPLSSFDDRIRLAAWRAIYGHGAMLQHAMMPVAPIRILVKNGVLTLEGVVANEMARNIAFLQANGVSGVFAVDNRLVVAGRENLK